LCSKLQSCKSLINSCAIQIVLCTEQCVVYTVLYTICLIFIFTVLIHLILRCFYKKHTFLSLLLLWSFIYIVKCVTRCFAVMIFFNVVFDLYILLYKNMSQCTLLVWNFRTLLLIIYYNLDLNLSQHLDWCISKILC